MDRRSVCGNAVVVGAGVMGAQIAAHLANAGWTATLLDIVPEGAADPKSRNGMSTRGLERAQKARPAAFFLPELSEKVTLGNVEDDLACLAKADWICEAVVEKEDVKARTHALIDSQASPNAIVTTNTSGLSISQMSDGCSNSYRSRFFGTHFFNPPRYMSLLELIPTPETDPAVLQKFNEYSEVVLGKSVVFAKDTPGFIANRLGVYAMQVALHATLKYGFTVEEADELTGPLIGHPKSGTFRLSDICGLDISNDVTTNLRGRLPVDRWAPLLSMPDPVVKLIASGRIGEKAGAGFYRKEKDRSISVLDWETLDYRPRKSVAFPSIEGLKSLPLAERLRALISLTDPAGKYLWETTRDVLCYTAEVAQEISDDIVLIDNACKWGFNWELGPFELWDALGVRETAERLEKEGFPVPSLVTELLQSGGESFYERQSGRTTFADISIPSNCHELKTDPERISLRNLKESGATVKGTPDANLIDIGDGAFCLEFTSKMNVLGPGTISMIDWSREYVEKAGAALVIGNQGEHFSAGFNIQLILLSIQEQDWDEMLQNSRVLQETVLRLKRSKIPVVAATHGYTLGGGCEVMLHCAAVQAAAESYIGLPETGIGVIPGGAGTTEMLLRSMEGVHPDMDPYPFVHNAFESIGMAKISGSAPEARKLGYLRDSDGITMGTPRVLFEAKQRALALSNASYRPAVQGKALVMGESGIARFDLELHLMQRAGWISEHDKLVGHELATVLCGGNLAHPQIVTEEYLLQVEREAFVRLCSTQKTAERVVHMLKTNKPLRN